MTKMRYLKYVFGGTIAFIGACPTSVFAQWETVINFDDQIAPCEFASAMPLRDQYASLGVHFIGWADENAGGAVLDECSAYGIPGVSPPNFLAVDSGQMLQNGTAASGPIAMQFDDPPRRIRVLVGGQVGTTASLYCSLPWGFPLVSDSVVLSDGMSTLEVSSDEPIEATWCFVENHEGPFIVDDLAFGFQQLSRPVPIDRPIALFSLTLLLATAGFWLLKNR